MNAARTKLWYRLHAWLGVGTGLFLLVYAGRWLLNRRRRPVTVDLRR